MGLTKEKSWQYWKKMAVLMICYRENRRAEIAYWTADSIKDKYNKFMTVDNFLNFQKITISKATGWKLNGRWIVKLFSERKEWLWGVIDGYSESNRKFAVKFSNQSQSISFNELEIEDLIVSRYPNF